MPIHFHENELITYFKSLDAYYELDLEELNNFYENFKSKQKDYKSFDKFLKFYETILNVNKIDKNEHKNYMYLTHIIHETIQKQLIVKLLE